MFIPFYVSESEDGNNIKEEWRNLEDTGDSAVLESGGRESRGMGRKERRGDGAAKWTGKSNAVLDREKEGERR